MGLQCIQWISEVIDFDWFQTCLVRGVTVDALDSSGIGRVATYTG